jgi:hypothetical protein
LFVVVILAFSACGSKDGPPGPKPGPGGAPTASPSNAVTADPPGAPVPAGEPAPVPEPSRDPYALGACEVTIGGGTPQKTPGGVSNVSTRYWAGPIAKNPPWALLINCGPWSLSGNGDVETFPMTPGRYRVVRSGLDPEPHVTVIGPSAVAGGELSIESWDMLHIRGTFELHANDGSGDPTLQVIKGAFDFKCPHTKPGEPCLDKPVDIP